MNERIKLLAVEAKLPDYVLEYGTELCLAPHLEKFAELLLTECCNKIESEYKYALGEKTQWAMSQDVQDLLKEHFELDKPTNL